MLNPTLRNTYNECLNRHLPVHHQYHRNADTKHRLRGQTYRSLQTFLPHMAALKNPTVDFKFPLLQFEFGDFALQLLDIGRIAACASGDYNFVAHLAHRGTPKIATSTISLSGRLSSHLVSSDSASS
jgi:hypothetical protein